MVRSHDLLKESLTNALEHAEGKKTLRTKSIVLPDPPKEYQSKDIKKLRQKMRCSQHVLAIILNVNVKTVQAWESGTRHPSSITNRLLELLDHENKRDSFFQAVGCKSSKQTTT